MKKVLSLGIAFLSFACHATQSEIDACLKSAVSASDQVQCLANLKARDDKLLNQRYKVAVANAAGVSSSTKAELVTAQRAWIQLRDHDCKFQRNWEQGSLGSVAYMYCTAQYTMLRADHLIPYASRKSAYDNIVKVPEGTQAVEKKVIISKAYASASSREKMAARILVEKSAFFTSSDLSKSKLLTLNWFTTRGNKDVFFYVKRGGVGYLAIVWALEDDTLEYVQHVKADSGTIYKISSSPTRIPDLGLVIDKKKVVWKFDGTKYSP